MFVFEKLRHDEFLCLINEYSHYVASNDSSEHKGNTNQRYLGRRELITENWRQNISKRNKIAPDYHEDNEVV